MNERDFDKIFGDKLKEEKDFPFTESKWVKMEKHLDRFLVAQQKRRLWWWLGLPFLALFGLLVGLTWLLGNVQKDIQNLTSEVRTLKEVKTTSPIPPSVLAVKNDTVYHHIIVKRYDTIFQTVVRREVVHTSGGFRSIGQPILKEHETEDSKIKAITEVPNSDNAGNFNSNKTVQSNTVQKVVTQKQSTQGSDLLPPLSIQAEKQLSDKVNLKKDSLTTNLGHTAKIDSDSLKQAKTPEDSLKTQVALVSEAVKNFKKDTLSENETKENFLKTDEKTLKKRLPILKPIHISAYELGILGGWAGIEGENIRKQSGYSVALKGGIGLGKHFKVIGEAQYIRLGFETDKITDKLDIPQIIPPSANHIFQEVNVEQPYLHYSLGLQYGFNINRFKPYLGASILGQSKLEEKFNYHFKNRITDEDIMVKTARHESSFQVPFLRAQVGVSYAIFGKWSVQAESTYDFNLEGSKRYFKPILQMKSGVLYRF